MLALFGSFAPLELGLVLIAAIMIFGRDLPRVAAQLFAQLAKVKRAMRDMWRETGMEEEMRRVRNEIDEVKLNLPSTESLDPRAKARQLAEDLDVQMREIPTGRSEFPSVKTEDADAAEGQDAELPPTPEELQRKAEEAEARASRLASEAQAKLRARRKELNEPEGEAERRA